MRVDANSVGFTGETASDLRQPQTAGSEFRGLVRGSHSKTSLLTSTYQTVSTVLRHNATPVWGGSTVVLVAFCAGREPSIFFVAGD